MPATVAIRDGRILVGLDDDVPRGARDGASRAPSGRPPGRVSPAALAGGGWAATTVSATMIAAHAAGIAVFATGGIGGVHRGALGGAAGAIARRSTSRRTWRSSAGRRWPSSAPARRRSSTSRRRSSTSRRAACRSSPSGQDELPGFYARTLGVPAPSSVAGRRRPRRALVRAHLGLGLGGAILVCVPVPGPDALPGRRRPRARSSGRIRDADARAASAGPALTPWLLARIAELTDGASVRANTALIVNNARVAGELAVRARGLTPPRGSVEFD